jgi:integrase
VSRKPSVRVFPTIQERPERPRPFLVRWQFDGKQKEKGFSTTTEANIFRSRLVVASVTETTKWNRATYLPADLASLSSTSVADWCVTYVADVWEYLAPNTRRSLVEALVYFIERSVPDNAPQVTPKWHHDLPKWLTPGTSVSLPRDFQQWLSRWSPKLEDLDEAALARIDKRLRQNIDGEPLARTTQARRVNVVKRCLEVAVRKRVMSVCEWPKSDHGERSRKSSWAKSSVTDDVPSVAELHAIIAAIPSHQPSSKMYQTLSAVSGYAGLRPGEAVALEVQDLELPAKGWGQISVRRSWNGTGRAWGTESEDLARPKTQRSLREVPIPPVLVKHLRDWITQQDISSGPLFVTRAGTRPTQSNWNRALKRACESVGATPLPPYGLRRTCASHLVDANVMIAEAAARLGHSPEVLLSIYTKRVGDGVQRSNHLLDVVYNQAESDCDSVAKVAKRYEGTITQ